MLLKESAFWIKTDLSGKWEWRKFENHFSKIGFIYL